MAKLAATYYQDILRGVGHFEVHESGKKAIQHFERNADRFFNEPIIFKSKPRISKDNTYIVGFYHRRYCVRFLEKEEVKAYNEYGEKCLINQSTAEIEAPTLELEKEKK